MASPKDSSKHSPKMSPQSSSQSLPKSLKKIKKIKASGFSRGFALAKMSMSVGAKAATNALGNFFGNEADKPERFKEMLMAQLEVLSQELGQLKGSLMKVGQMLSMYGEHFLPPEANAVLKSLQSQSPPVEWKAVEKVLRKQLSPEKLAELEIDQEPLASASLGQVHRATRKSDGLKLVLKIQYPGVDKAIEGDLKSLQSILSLSKLIPRGPKYDELFKEVRAMLHQEVDYSRELRATEQFRKILEKDSRYIIPKTHPEYSTKRMLALSFEEGIPVDSPEILGLPQDRRNALGLAALELYFLEIFEVGMVQTDPHFGNYRVRLGENGKPDQLILFDFGAVRVLEKGFLDPYREMVRGALDKDSARIIQAANDLGFLKPEDPEDKTQLFTEFCQLITEPFSTDKSEVPPALLDEDGAYLWGESDLPTRAARKGAELALAFKLRSPPREIVFLDRKLGGIFIFLSVLQVKLKGQTIIKKYMSKD